MPRIFLKVRKKEKTIKTAHTEITFPISYDTLYDQMVELGRELDIPVPMILTKHISELNAFTHTAFLPDDFVEEVEFDRLEAEMLIDKKKKQK